ncbi:hypothetical protein N431DRAFT_559607 [Stipitochalara longipes BDJ]|nr:hypothetical protein N431DRAFT_559607 [Stipitochalara longipes BDJ]
MDMRMSASKQDLSDRWIQHQRSATKTTPSWACIYCPNRKIFATECSLWEHAKTDHVEELEGKKEDLNTFPGEYTKECFVKRSTKDNRRQRFSPNATEANRVQPELPLLIKRALEPVGRLQPTRCALDIGALDINTPRVSADVDMRDLSDGSQAAEENRPPKRAAIGDGISAESGSPFRDSSPSSSPRRSKARPTSSQFERQDGENFHARPSMGKRQLWQVRQPNPRSSFNDPSNLASIAAQKADTKQYPKIRKPFQPPPPSFPSPRPSTILPTIPSDSSKFGVPTMTKSSEQSPDNYEIVLQPETRPISQEQLVAEVKGIYAGLVMVEARCIEVDNKQAALAQADPGSQPKLNNEQWQALIALHRTLLHEHHDFFLASQHPSASPALRRLASKYAMPARMWRHGIHSFLELLRHRLPASLDHMLAFIYLAYSMMALLYETVPAFKDTWIECLGDLGRYRMAIEDDDIRDREVWTGVARHWYSKASDKSPTTGRLYHHLAILARPNALQQLFYYSKSLCVVIPFTSARDSILMLFDPVLTAENGPPPLDISFAKAHGLLFQNKKMKRSKLSKEEFLTLLENQIERSTRKWKAHEYHIAVANCKALLGFASKDNDITKILSSTNMEHFQVEHTSTLFSIPTHLEQNSLDGQPKLSPHILDTCLEGESCHDTIQTQELPYQCTVRGSNTVTDNASNWEWLLLVFQRLRNYMRAIGIFTLYSQFGIVAASGTAGTEKKFNRIFQPLLEPEAVKLACTLGTSVIGARYFQQHWDVDMWLLLNILFHFGILILAQDPSFSDGELLILCIYGAGINVHWVKKKLMKLRKTGGITALVITVLSLYSGCEFAHQIPGLEGRFDNKCMSKAIASLPSAAGYSVVWWAVIEKSRLADTIEARIDDPQSWQFILGLLRACLIHCLSRGIQVFMERVLGRFDPGFQNNLFQGLAQHVQADPRAPWNEPFDAPAPGNGNNLFREPVDVEEDPRVYRPRHGLFRGLRNENNAFRRPQDLEADPSAYFPRNEPNPGPDDENFYRRERQHGPSYEEFDRQQSEDNYHNSGIYRQDNEDELSDRAESPLYQH